MAEIPPMPGIISTSDSSIKGRKQSADDAPTGRKAKKPKQKNVLRHRRALLGRRRAGAEERTGIMTASMALLASAELAGHIARECAKAQRMSVATALATDRGVADIEPALEHLLDRGGELLFLFGTDLPTEPSAIRRLLKLARRFDGQVQVRCFQPNSVGIFHPKLTIFRRSSGSQQCLVGSANLTYCALYENWEATVVVEDSRTCKQLCQFFEDCFWGEESDRVDLRWLSEYRKRWRKQRMLLRRLEPERRTQLPIRMPAERPNRIQSYRFAITGKLENWTRSQITDELTELGGMVVENPLSMHSVDCLVKGTFTHGAHSSAKKVGAKEHKISQIDESELMKLIDRERRLRRRTWRSRGKK